MVARWLQDKKLKQRKQRRAWAKSYSMKSTGIAANPGYINDQGEWVDISLGSRAKAGGRVEPEHLTTRFKDRNPLFKFDATGKAIPNEEGIFARIEGSGANPRAIVLAKLIRSSNNAGSLQGEMQYVCHTIHADDFLKVRLYMGGDEAFIVVQEMNEKRVVYKRSITYFSMYGKTAKVNAYQAWERGRVAWKEVEAVPIPPSNSG